MIDTDDHLMIKMLRSVYCHYAVRSHGRWCGNDYRGHP